MTKTLEINLKNHWTTAKEGVFILAFLPIGLLVGHLSGILTKSDYPDVLVISGLFYLLLFLPAIYFHFTYYRNNRGLKIVIDTESKVFFLTRGGHTKEYSYSDIIHSEKNLNIYNKNKIDKAMRWTTPWSGYNYIKVRLKDGTSFFVTSLMADIVDLDFKCNETHYSLFTPLLERDWQTIDYSNHKFKDN
jgi:hypothetical protein